MSARCEDYPCCGHEPGGCPNNDGTHNCATCGKKLPPNSRSSICEKCRRRDDRQREEYGDYELGESY